MPVTISVSKTEARYDSQLPPVVTVTGAETFLPYTYGVLKVEDWFYIPLHFMPFIWYPPNRTKDVCSLQARKIEFPNTVTLTYGTGVENDGVDVVRDSGESWNGAYYNTSLSTSKCAVEGKAVSFTLTAGISLQSGTINHDYTNVAVEHSILFGQQGIASIRELGVVKKKFSYAVGDKVMIERIDYGGGNVIVRYYKITPDSKMEIIRSTRSKLTDTATIKAEAMVYHTGARVDEFGIFNNEDAATFIKLAGVLENFQDWENELQFVSSGDSIQMADNSLRWSYANRKKILRGLQLTRTGADKETERDLFVEFFDWHKNETEFIFVDFARKENDLPTEWWARFANPLSDKTKNGCRFQNGTAIIEDFRDEFIKKELDVAAPAQITGLMAFAIEDDSFGLSWDIPTDNVEVVGYQLGIDGIAYPIEPVVTGDVSYDVISGVDGITLNPDTDYQVTVRAYDRAGNFGTWAEEITVHTTGDPDTEAPTIPTGFAMSAASDTEINCVWTESTDDVSVVGYTITIAKNAGFTVDVQNIVVGNVDAYQIDGLDPSTQYWGKVKATDGTNFSDYSNTDDATTDDEPAEAVDPVLDNFTGAADTSLNGRIADTLENGTDGWHERGEQVFSLHDGIVEPANPGLHSIASYECNASDGTITAVYAASSQSGGGIIVRCVDDNNLLSIYMSGTDISLYQKVAGTYSQIGGLIGNGSSVVNGSVVEVVFNGDSITFKSDGSTVGGWTTSQFQTATEHGLRAVNGAKWESWGFEGVGGEGGEGFAVLVEENGETGIVEDGGGEFLEDA